jgi:hypothetical protein
MANNIIQYSKQSLIIYLTATENEAAFFTN